MNTLFTKRAARMPQLAAQEAQRFHHEVIGPEHLLLSLISDGNGTAATVLKNLEVDPECVRRDVESLMQPGPEDSMTKPGLGKSLKNAVESALGEARRLEHEPIGTGHLLLGVLSEPEELAAQVLRAHGVTLDNARAEVVKLDRV